MWELTIDGRERARLRIDRSERSARDFTGTLKVYATVSGGWMGEEPQHDIRVTRWDGANLSFTLFRDGIAWSYTASVEGRLLRGERTGMGQTHRLTGARAELLSHGITARREPERAAWRAITLARLRHLMMAGAPAPLSVAPRWVSREGPPMEAALANGRDDNASDHPQSYVLSELYLDVTIADPHGAPLSREIHLYVARPTSPEPAGGYPVAIALNGHFGSAYAMMNPGGDYWYGEAFARRGYLVAAVDVSHRPLSERSEMYSDELTGDDPAHGNGLHPAIASPGLRSDWEEDGERAWDAMRALDFVVQNYNANPRRVVAVGHSMGGSIATVLGALDPRISLTLSSAFASDLGDLQYGTGHRCWRWLNADAREYLDVSDYHALIAPRGLIVQTGARDVSYSTIAAPFAGAKQVMRRSFSAYERGSWSPLCVHFLHRDGHVFHAAELGASLGLGVTTPAESRPVSPWEIGWQSDPELVSRRVSLFDMIDRMLNAVR